SHAAAERRETLRASPVAAAPPAATRGAESAPGPRRPQPPSPPLAARRAIAGTSRRSHPQLSHRSREAAPLIEVKGTRPAAGIHTGLGYCMNRCLTVAAQRVGDAVTERLAPLLEDRACRVEDQGVIVGAQYALRAEANDRRIHRRLGVEAGRGDDSETHHRGQCTQR